MKNIFFIVAQGFFTLLYFIFSLLMLIILSILPKKKVYQIYKKLDAKEEQKRIQDLREFVKPGERLLDFGSGSGRFGKIVQNTLSVEVTGVDVVDYADHEIPFFVYDGQILPFPDNHFDTVFVAFVLHHTTDHDKIFKELVRVSKNKIIVFEDTYHQNWEKYFVSWNDYQVNILQGWIKFLKKYFKGNPANMPMPLTFRSVNGWKTFFSNYPIKIVDVRLRKMGYKPLTKGCFVLVKK